MSPESESIEPSFFDIVMDKLLVFGYSTDGQSSSTPNQSQPVSTSRFASDDLSSLLVISVVIGCLILISIIAAMLWRKRKLDRLRSILLPMYTFDANEADNWDSELLQPDNNRSTCEYYLECRWL